MYTEREFENWRDGLIHLVIVVMLPIFPIIIYMITNGESDSYLYILFLTVIISLIYEYMSGYNKDCSMWIKAEHMISSAVLIIMLLITVFLLLLSASQGSTKNPLGTIDYILPFLFLVPVICTVIEIIRCIIYEIELSEKNEPDKNNLKGAAGV